MLDLKIVVGKIEVKSKTTGNSFFTYHLMEEFTDYEVQNAEKCVGHKVFSVGTRLDFDVNIGDKVICYYDKGFKGEAVISEMIVKEKAKVSAQN